MTNGVRTVQRAFELLEVFNTRQQPMRLRDLVDATGHPSSSISDLLKTLSKLGYLNFDRSSRSYLPTPKIASMGRWIEEALLEKTNILGALRDLSEKTGETVLLGTAHGLEVQYLRTLPSTAVVRYVVPSDTRRPLIRSSLGIALLSVEEPARIERIYQASNGIDRRRISLAEVKRLAAGCEQQGFIYLRNFVHDGVAMIAAPIRGLAPMGRQLAICIAGPLDRMDRLHTVYERHVRKAAKR